VNSAKNKGPIPVVQEIIRARYVCRATSGGIFLELSMAGVQKNLANGKFFFETKNFTPHDPRLTSYDPLSPREPGVLRRAVTSGPFVFPEAPQSPYKNRIAPPHNRRNIFSETALFSPPGAENESA